MYQNNSYGHSEICAITFLKTFEKVSMINFEERAVFVKKNKAEQQRTMLIQ